MPLLNFSVLSSKSVLVLQTIINILKHTPDLATRAWSLMKKKRWDLKSELIKLKANIVLEIIFTKATKIAYIETCHNCITYNDSMTHNTICLYIVTLKKKDVHASNLKYIIFFFGTTTIKFISCLHSNTVCIYSGCHKYLSDIIICCSIHVHLYTCMYIMNKIFL